MLGVHFAPQALDKFSGRVAQVSDDSVLQRVHRWAALYAAARFRRRTIPSAAVVSPWQEIRRIARRRGAQRIGRRACASRRRNRTTFDVPFRRTDGVFHALFLAAQRDQGVLRVHENLGGDNRRRGSSDGNMSDFVPKSEQGGLGSLHFPLPFRPSFFHHFGNTTTRIGRHPAPAPRTASAFSLTPASR